MRNYITKLNKVLVIVMAVVLSLASTIPAYAFDFFNDAEISGSVFHYVPIHATPKVSGSDVLLLESQLDRLPEKVKSIIQDTDMEIFLFTASEKELHWDAVTRSPKYVFFFDDNGNVGSVECQDAECFEIDIKAEHVADYNGRLIYHEIGHVIDNTCYGGPMKTLRQWGASDTPEFTGIIAAERGNLRTIYNTHEHNVSNNEETFAEAFGTLMANPEAMQSKCPLMTAYIINVIDSYGYTESEPVEQIVEPVQEAIPQPLPDVTVEKITEAPVAEKKTAEPKPAVIEEEEETPVPEKVEPIQTKATEDPSDPIVALEFNGGAATPPARRESETMILKKDGYEIKKKRSAKISFTYKPIAENNKENITISYRIIEKEPVKVVWYKRFQNWLIDIWQELTS